MTKQVRSLNNDQVHDLARRLTERAITKGIGTEGAAVAEQIGAKIAELLPLWRQYAGMVQGVEIDMQEVAAMFAPQLFATLSRAKLDKLTGDMQKCAGKVNEAIGNTIQYFEYHQQLMEQHKPEISKVLDYQLARQLGHDVTPGDFQPKAE